MGGQVLLRSFDLELPHRLSYHALEASWVRWDFP